MLAPRKQFIDAASYCAKTGLTRMKRGSAFQR
jgi:hypothetical protein